MDADVGLTGPSRLAFTSILSIILVPFLASIITKERSPILSIRGTTTGTLELMVVTIEDDFGQMKVPFWDTSIHGRD